MEHQLNIFDIKRFAVHDGPGIRTTLFLKGCPLRCLWCHNPEGMSAGAQMALYQQKCLGCGECVRSCKNGAHTLVRAGHGFLAEKCDGCQACAEACLGGALKIYGRRMDVDTLHDMLMADRDFYTGGGCTLSGGEPLLQAAPAAALLRKLKHSGVHTAVDTCGDVPWEAFEAVRGYTDLFLFDIKHMDSAAHRRLTGAGNERILENLSRLARTGAQIEVRMPIIPGINDDARSLMAARDLLRDIKPVRIALLPYHSLAGSKYQALGMEYKMPPEISAPDNAHMARILDMFSGLNAVCPALE